MKPKQAVTGRRLPHFSSYFINYFPIITERSSKTLNGVNIFIILRFIIKSTCIHPLIFCSFFFHSSIPSFHNFPWICFHWKLFLTMNIIHSGEIPSLQNGNYTRFHFQFATFFHPSILPLFLNSFLSSFLSCAVSFWKCS